jgi:predicted protein tyrosine phosphatase
MEPVTLMSSMPVKIVVTDRESIERGVLVRSSYVVVSIHDPDKPPPRVRRQSGFRDVLQLAFHDAEPVPSSPLPAGVRAMSREDAAAIWAFLSALGGDAGCVVVHCEQGMSRSPAVAAAIARAWRLDESRIWRNYQPNRHVFELMCRATPSHWRGPACESTTDSA